jgi:hypothetical protein
MHILTYMYICTLLATCTYSHTHLHIQPSYADLSLACLTYISCMHVLTYMYMCTLLATCTYSHTYLGYILTYISTYEPSYADLGISHIHILHAYTHTLTYTSTNTVLSLR